MKSIVVPMIGDLYYEGNISLLQNRIACIIGTRNPSDKAIGRAREISELAIREGYTTLSGLALGIDTIVHEASIESTIAVVPFSLDDKIYPHENEELYYKILNNNGLVISPFKRGSKLSKYSFVERDKLQAFLSRLVVVVESDIKGGSIHALKWALSHSRPSYIYEDEERLSPFFENPLVTLIKDTDNIFV